MKAKQIIKAFPTKYWQADDELYLRVSEFYFDTIQGEGFYVGYPAAFLRLQGCPLSCTYCDTTEVWRTGNPYTFEELNDMIEEHGLLEQLRKGQHLVITGGSPLMQQKNLTLFLNKFIKDFEFKPFIEIENECYFQPQPELCALVDCWNNSPKLSSSGVPLKKRGDYLAIATVAVMLNSWFKFVITKPMDWGEINLLFLDTKIIRRDQIILMPEGATEKELANNREMVIELAIKHNVRYTTREHIVVWGKKTGI